MLKRVIGMVSEINPSRPSVSIFYIDRVQNCQHADAGSAELSRKQKDHLDGIFPTTRKIKPDKVI